MEQDKIWDYFQNEEIESFEGSYGRLAYILKNCKNKNIKTNRSKAKKQLIATIDFFTKNLALEQKLEAYICISCSSNDAGFIMTPRADNMEAISQFDELYNTALFYKCQKEF